MLQIEKFKPYDEFVIETWGDTKTVNWTDIQDKLIRLMAKYTDRYAGDIIIDINSIQKYIDSLYEIFETSWLFGFRENGVDHREYVLNSCETGAELSNHYRSIWRLDLTKHAEYPENIVLRFYKVSYTGGF